MTGMLLPLLQLTRLMTMTCSLIGFNTVFICYSS